MSDDLRSGRDVGTDDWCRVHIVYVDSFKGGVAKTTTSYWLARALSDHASTVLIGTSPQNDVLDYLPQVPSVRRGLREALADGGPAQVLDVGGMDLLPAGYAAAPTDPVAAAAVIRSTVHGGGWHFAVVDGFNFVDPLCVAGLLAADMFIAPTTIYPESTRAVIRAFRFIAERVPVEYRPQVAKVLLTQVPTKSRRSKVEEVLYEAICDVWAPRSFTTQIRRSARYALTEMPGGSNSAGVRGALVGDRGVIRDDYVSLGGEVRGLLCAGTCDRQER